MCFLPAKLKIIYVVYNGPKYIYLINFSDSLEVGNMVKNSKNCIFKEIYVMKIRRSWDKYDIVLIYNHLKLKYNLFQSRLPIS